MLATSGVKDAFTLARLKAERDDLRIKELSAAAKRRFEANGRMAHG